MSDSIELRINGYKYTSFAAYSVDSDIYEAADQFEFQLYPDSAFVPVEGMKCEFFVNKKLEFTGVIDTVTTGYSSSGRYVNISGRDVMGLVVDSYVEQFETIQNISLPDVAERLLKDVPYIKTIEYDEGADKRDSKKPFIQTEPGQKIFDILKDVAASRGLVFYCRANGVLVFRKPRGRGRAIFGLTQKEGSFNSQIMSGELVKDITTRYAKYTVVTQEQGGDESDPASINGSATINDDDFPFNDVLHKPYVEAIADDKGSPKQLAQARMERGKVLSNGLNYKVRGHSYCTHNWAIDELARIDDDKLNIHSNMLIYKRTFRGAPSGQTTDIRLGLPGLIA